MLISNPIFFQVTHQYKEYERIISRIFSSVDEMQKVKSRYKSINFVFSDAISVKDLDSCFPYIYTMCLTFSLAEISEFRVFYNKAYKGKKIGLLAQDERANKLENEIIKNYQLDCYDYRKHCAEHSVSRSCKTVSEYLSIEYPLSCVFSPADITKSGFNPNQSLKSILLSLNTYVNIPSRHESDSFECLDDRYYPYDSINDNDDPFGWEDPWDGHPDAAGGWQ